MFDKFRQMPFWRIFHQYRLLSRLATKNAGMDYFFHPAFLLFIVITSLYLTIPYVIAHQYTPRYLDRS